MWLSNHNPSCRSAAKPLLATVWTGIVGLQILSLLQNNCNHKGRTLPAKYEKIHIPHVINVPRPQDVVNPDDVLVVEAQQDLDFSQSALAVRLVLEWTDFLDGHALICQVIQGRAAKQHKRTHFMLHDA